MLAIKCPVSPVRIPLQRPLQRLVVGRAFPYVEPPAIVRPKVQVLDQPSVQPAPAPRVQDWEFGDLVNEAKAHHVKAVEINERERKLHVTSADDQVVDITAGPRVVDLGFVNLMVDNGVEVSYARVEPNYWQYIGLFLEYGITAIILMSLISIFVSQRNVANGANSPFSFTKSRAKLVEKADSSVTFEDVAGLDGAKQELVEIVDFLQNPEKYSVVGAKIPRGCLLVGPPGTGKTLLARAIAGEAKVPFFSCSASEFVEMFVGVGAARIREMFKQATEKAPCIIFIDEIDAIGKARGGGVSGGFGGGNDEREQTVNQLLTEMDGFQGNNGVIVIAATNRADVLDQALLRPGRFDRQIQVELPDVSGRESILQVHTRTKPLAEDVDLHTIAKITAGLSGADLGNLANESAILAARRGDTQVRMVDFEHAIERVQIGIEKGSSMMSEEKKWIVAIHEAGHALTALMVGDYDDLRKVTIIPRGGAGGVTYFSPSQERLDGGLLSRDYLDNQIAVALGGRIAEEIVFGHGRTTTGAAGDIERVFAIARYMVTRYGFSERMGPIAWSANNRLDSSYSESTAYEIDKEIKRIVHNQYERAMLILLENKGMLHKLAQALLEKETLTGEEVMHIVTRKP